MFARLLTRIVSVGSMRIVAAVLSLALFWYVARARGAHELGELALLLGIFTFFQQMPLLGLHLLVARDVAGDPDAAPRLVANAAALSLAASLFLCAGVAAAGAWLYPAALSTPIGLMALALVPTSLVIVAEMFLIARQRMHLYAVISVTETGLRVAASLIALHLGAGLVALMVIFLCGRLLVALAYASTGEFARTLRAGRIDATVLAGYLRAAPILLGILLLTSTLARFDIFLLSALASLAEVGIYSAAYKVYETALLAPSVVTVVLFPVLSKLKHTRPERFESVAARCMGWLVVAGVPCALAVAVLAHPLVTLLFGDAFAPAALVLQLLIGCSVLVALDQVLALVLLVHARQDLDLAVLAVAASCYVAALLALIPAWGYVGAAAATVIAAVVQLGARLYCVRTRLGLFRLRILPAVGSAR
jgi:O-antigen/teichoic acid export membrane protein